MSDEADFEGWAILELMGHRRLGGWVSEVEFAGGKFVRLDVPAVLSRDERAALPPSDGGGPPAPAEIHATQLYGASAIYCLTPTDEATARMVARASVAAPVSRWELPSPDDGDDADDAELVDEHDLFP